ncbi:MAG: hypothetical protein GC162_02170 [Planctomycetes bacterium]|nr:hypothetical protein [Planctomycetota bacterium]
MFRLLVRFPEPSHGSPVVLSWPRLHFKDDDHAVFFHCHRTRADFDKLESLHRLAGRDQCAIDHRPRTRAQDRALELEALRLVLDRRLCLG